MGKLVQLQHGLLVWDQPLAQIMVTNEAKYRDEGGQLAVILLLIIALVILLLHNIMGLLIVALR